MPRRSRTRWRRCSRRSQSAKANMPISRRTAASTPHASQRLDDDLGIRAALEAASPRAQLLAQLLKVVHLAVVGDDIAPAAGEHRLMAERATDRRSTAAGAQGQFRLPRRPTRRCRPARDGAGRPPWPCATPRRSYECRRWKSRKPAIPHMHGFLTDFRRIAEPGACNGLRQRLALNARRIDGPRVLRETAFFARRRQRGG